MSIWRTPAEETNDYPDLWVHDGRVTGSITHARSRLPVWCTFPRAVRVGWAEAVADYGRVESDEGFDADSAAGFIYNLLEHRGEFARLLCILADVIRLEDEVHEAWADEQGGGVILIADADGPVPGYPDSWWETPALKQRVADQLRRCLATLEAE